MAGSGITLNLRNNNFANWTGTQTGTPFHAVITTFTTASTIASSTSEINYNNLYVANPANGFVARVNTTNHATIAAYDGGVTSPASNDANSISVDSGLLRERSGPARLW